MFAIVAFTKEEDSLGIIPTNWINYAQMFCLFPNVNTDKKKNQLIIRRELPENNWRQCPIRILKEYGDYDTARGHLTEAEETSNLESDNGTTTEYSQRRRRKTKSIRLPGEDSSEDSEEHISDNQKINYINYPAPPKETSSNEAENEALYIDEEEVPAASTASVSSNSAYSSVQHLSNFPLNNLINRVGYLEANQNLLFKTVEDYAGFINKLEINLNTLNEKVDKVLDLLENRQRDRPGSEVDQRENDMLILSKLPLKEEEDFCDLNNKILESPVFRQTLSRLLYATNGKDGKNFATNIMAKVLDNSLAMTYSLTGKNIKNGPVKSSFEKTAFFKFIYDLLARKFKDHKDADVRDGISNWLMQAKFRNQKKSSRLNKGNESALQPQNNV